ncbi:MAG: helix-turn-helix transcriptional regulator [Candidatus Bathyarchaeota archaeon]|nr:MAG: helix-turn-helix transcriptional regulator [Candidatus Bathyarchaeota archaeon]
MWRNFIAGHERISPIQVLILLQLRKQPMYGYEILKSLRERFADTWEPKTGTVYPALRSLETRGFVQTQLKAEKEVYSLTDKGNEILEDVGGLLEGNLQFAGKFYRFLPHFHRERIIERMRKNLSSGRLPPFPPFFPLSSPNGVDDKGTRIRNLKMMREIGQKCLQIIEDEIRTLERTSDRDDESNDHEKTEKEYD